MIKKIVNKIKFKLFHFNPQYKKNKKIVHLGTFYGGYDLNDDDLFKPTIISCGLGEDASFDIEMINKYDARVINIDPTPRSKKYYNSIESRFGMKKDKNYNESGYLSPRSYDLSKVNKSNFILLENAIWSNSDENLKLYMPENKQHVSLSINNKKNKNQNFYLAKTIDYNSIIKRFNLTNIHILKLDIEGSEIETLNSVLKSKILPLQILVEFDIRRKPSLKNRIALTNIHKKICKYYELININQKGDFTYYLRLKS